MPPTQNARPLPTKSNKGTGTKGTPKSSKGTGIKDTPKSSKDTGTKDTQNPRAAKKRKTKAKVDDAPRVFRRIMALASGKKVRSGEDDGSGGPKNKKKPVLKQVAQPLETPKIRPGEDMRAFAQRVNAALPVSGLTRKSIVKDGKDEQGVKVNRTIKEKKMHKLYDEWRAEERKIYERREEDLELAAEKALENDAEGITSSSAAFLDDTSEPTAKKGRKKGGRRKAEVEEDPWEELKKKRGEAKVGLHDVVLAPPTLHKKTTRQLRVDGDGNAADVDGVPRASGSLRRREELQAVRQDVLDAYRKIREHEQAKTPRGRERL